MHVIAHANAGLKNMQIAQATSAPVAIAANSADFEIARLDVVVDGSSSERIAASCSGVYGASGCSPRFELSLFMESS